VVEASSFLLGMPSPEVVERDVWGAIAFLGRYGHQPASEMLSLARRELTLLVDRLVYFIEREHASGTRMEW